MRSYLIVDDNVALAENLAEIIRERGDEASVATSPSRALALLREIRFDGLVTDMRMPVMNGAQLVREARRIDPGIPVVVLTAYTGDGDLADIREEGVLTIFPKPVPIQRLLALLAIARRNGLVAVVDDDRSLVDALVDALRTRGFSAVPAHSAEEVARMKSSRPFAAVVDLRLPDSPRGEVLTRLAQRFEGLPLVIVTAFRDLPLPVTPVKLFEKPFVTAQLLQTLEGLHQDGAMA